MGVPNDGACYRPGDSRWDLNPYTAEHFTAPARRPDTGYRPAAVFDQVALTAAIRELLNRGVLIVGRFCYVCFSDLADAETLRSSNRAAYEAMQGQRNVQPPCPQGGHEPDCPLPELLELLDGPSIYTRRREPREMTVAEPVGP